MRFSRYFYYLPILCLIAGLISQYSGLDIKLASLFYDAQQHKWPYKELWLTEIVLHRGARLVVALIFISVIATLVMSFMLPTLQKYRKSALYILLAGLSGILVVGYLKSQTHIYTPWDLDLFGGPYPNIRLFDRVSPELPVGHAFPAGHASGGFAMLSFYFLFYLYGYRHSRKILYVVLMFGLLLGFAQQLRGAHMLSHDLFSLAICWMCCLLWMKLIMRGEHKLLMSS